jgi:hydroxymethylglutaryl-CoA reductase
LPSELHDCGTLDGEDAACLSGGYHVLSAPAADHMIENVVGVFGMPFAITPNFIVNGRECLVPLVVEEPSMSRQSLQV